jgi:mannose-6-phosphate isomerase-like protein (cupin superfamily)
MSRGARVVTLEELPWWQPPGHPGALSKLLVNPATVPTRHFDFRVSLYPPGGEVEDHAHERAEHVYYVLSGRGLMTLDGERTVVGPHRAVFIPPGVRHAFVNNGLEDLVFVVVTSPPGELPLDAGPE